MTAVGPQWELLERGRKYAEDRGLDCIGGDDVGREVLRRWESVLTGLEAVTGSLAGQVDWIAKHRLIDGYRARNGLAWAEASLAAMDLQYHALRQAKSMPGRTEGRPRSNEGLILVYRLYPAI